MKFKICREEICLSNALIPEDYTCLIAMDINITFFSQSLQQPSFTKVQFVVWFLKSFLLIVSPVVSLASEYAYLYISFIFSQKVLQTRNLNLIKRTVLRMPLHAVIPLLQEVTEYSFHFKVLTL